MGYRSLENDIFPKWKTREDVIGGVKSGEIEGDKISRILT